MKLSTSLLFAIAATGLLSLSQAGASLNSTYLFTTGEQYAAFTLGSRLGDSSFTGTTVTGDIGVGGMGMDGGGLQTLDLDPTDSFNGNVIVYPGTTVNGSPTFVGSHSIRTGNATTLTSQENQFYSASTTLNGMPTADNFTSSNNRLFSPTAANLNLSGGANISLTETSSANSVLKLNSFTMTNATLNLVGNNSNSTFVFDISGVFLLSNAKINLSGGLTQDNVIFNVTGTASNENTPGYYMLLNSQVNGTILAPYRTISLNNSTLTGSAVGERIVSSNGSTITEYPASP